MNYLLHIKFHQRLYSIPSGEPADAIFQRGNSFINPDSARDQITALVKSTLNLLDIIVKTIIIFNSSLCFSFHQFNVLDLTIFENVNELNKNVIR